jgi:hypothetical protein
LKLFLLGQDARFLAVNTLTMYLQKRGMLKKLRSKLLNLSDTIFAEFRQERRKEHCSWTGAIGQ